MKHTTQAPQRLSFKCGVKLQGAPPTSPLECLYWKDRSSKCEHPEQAEVSRPNAAQTPLQFPTGRSGFKRLLA